MNDYLTGSNKNLSTVIDTTLDRLRGLTQEGNNVVTTLDLAPSGSRCRRPGGQCGAAVALEPATGRVLVMASSPTFNPNLVETDFGAIEAITAPCRPAAPLLDRASAGLFIPGSTFKVVTAAAALDTGRFTPESVFDDPGFCTLFGKRVTNFADQSGPEVFGTSRSPRRSRTRSTRSSATSARSSAPTPSSSRRSASASTSSRRSSFPPRRCASAASTGTAGSTTRDPSEVDPGRLAFGQERLLSRRSRWRSSRPASPTTA